MRKINFLFLLSLVMFFLPFQVQAKGKSINVVSRIEIKDSQGADLKRVFYQHGLIKAIRSKNQDMDFKYKKNKIVEMCSNIKTGPLKGKTTSSYIWKKNHIFTKQTLDNIATEKTVYTWKNGKCTSSFEKYLDFNDSGNFRKFSYKNGVVKKVELTYVGITKNSIKYKYDKKRNLKSVSVTYAGGKLKTYQAKLSYKKGKLVKIQTKEYDPFSDKLLKKTIRIQYKKIKVAPADYKIIKEQQWQLINPEAFSFAW